MYRFRKGLDKGNPVYLNEPLALINTTFILKEPEAVALWAEVLLTAKS